MSATRADSSNAEVLEERRRLAQQQLRRSPSRSGPTARRPSRGGGRSRAAIRADERRCAGQVALADVEQHQDRLLGQEPEATMAFSSSGSSARSRIGAPPSSPVSMRSQDRRPRVRRPRVRPACRAGRWCFSRSIRRSAIDRSARRNSRSSRSRSRAGSTPLPSGWGLRSVLEGANHVEQGVGIANRGPGGRPAAPRSRRGPPVDGGGAGRST